MSATSKPNAQPEVSATPNAIKAFVDCALEFAPTPTGDLSVSVTNLIIDFENTERDVLKVVLGRALTQAINTILAGPPPPRNGFSIDEQMILAKFRRMDAPQQAAFIAHLENGGAQ